MILFKGYFRSAIVAMFVFSIFDLGCRHSKRGEDLEPPTPDIALRGIPDRKNIHVVLETDRGVIHCTLDATQTLRAASLFVGLATGRAAHRDPRSSAIVRSPLYRHRLFFRTIPDVYVQTGCPLDNGTGHPGYRIPAETHPDDSARLAEPGALVLLPYTAPPNREDPAPPPPGHTIGSQFAVTMTNMQHLAGKVTVLGRCGDLEVARRIGRAREHGDSPVLVQVMVEGVSD